MTLYLTFDIGTTALKTALVAEDGRVLGIHTSEHTFHCPRPDWAQMEPGQYWNAAVSGTRAVFQHSGADPRDLAAVGFSSQGQTFIPIDRSGAPLHDAIVWTDKRAAAIAREWEERWLDRDQYRRISGYPWLPGELTLFKIAWLKENAPEVHRAWKFLFLPDFLGYRMTGEIITDRVTAQYSGLFDLQTCDWHPRLLAAAGITEDQLPALMNPGDIAGRVGPGPAAELGIPSGVPVCLGANDQIAGAVGAGNVRPGIVSETTGTALAVVATTETLVDDTRMCVGRHAAPGAFFAMPFTNTSAIVLKWFRDLCCQGVDYDDLLAGLDRVPPGSDGLTVLPHFAGTASPTFDPDVRGAISGLTLGHTREHIARAILEACCCELQECVDLVLDHGIAVQSIRSLGGAARSDLWLQMKSDMLGIRVERPLCPDAASLGAAMLAATGVGQFRSVEEAAQAWYREGTSFEPNAELYPCYRAVYQRYNDLYARLYG